MYFIISVIASIFAILNIILYFKIWGMTNNISEIKDCILLFKKDYDTKTVESSTQNKNSDGINDSRKVTRVSDNKKMITVYIIGDKYECIDPETKESLGKYSEAQIKKGW